MVSKIREAILAVTLGLAGCVAVDQGSLLQFEQSATHDRYVPGTVQRTAEWVEPWLEAHHCAPSKRLESGVMWIECATGFDSKLCVMLTPWERKDGVYTRVHVEGESQIGLALLERIDNLNEQRAHAPGKDASLLAKRTPTDAERAAEMVKRLHGTLDRTPGGTVTGVDLHLTHVTDQDLALLPAFPYLQKLNLYGAKQITDGGLANLAACPRLQTLYLNQTNVSDSGLEYLRRLTTLRDLGLYETRVTDKGLECLKGLTNLQDLTLSGNHITDAGLVTLKAMPGLHVLHLYGTALSETAIAELKRTNPRLTTYQGS
jgi:hypothetical protein